jgi:hypothetical protein
VVPRPSPGLQVSATVPKAGWNGVPIAMVRFDQVHVPASHRLGDEGRGMAIAQDTLLRARIGHAAIALGRMRGALQIATQYAASARCSARRWPATRASSGWWRSMAATLESTRCLVYSTALRYDAGDADAGVHASIAKMHATDACMRLVVDALQLLGGNGYLRAYPLERFFRDAKMNQIGEGTSEIHKGLIGRHVLQQAAGLPQHPCLDLDARPVVRRRGSSMGLSNALCRRLGIRVPIFGLAHSIDVAAAISRAGGLGIYAAARDGPDELAGKLRALRALCPDHPVGVDLLLPTALPAHSSAADVAAAVPEGHRRWVQQLADRHGVPPATRGNFFSQYVRSQALFNEQVDAVVASGLPVFAAGVGTPAAVLARAKAAGQHTIALVGHPRHAAKAIDAGVDILVAQGHEAGGHTGPIGTWSLVPQIVAAAGGGR